MRGVAIIAGCFLWACALGQTSQREIDEIVFKLDTRSPTGKILEQSISDRKSPQKVLSYRRHDPSVRKPPSILDGIYKIKLKPGEDLRQLLDSLNSVPGVLYAEPVYQEQLLEVPNDPHAQPDSSQTYLSVIQAYDAWDVSKSSEDIIIGIIDTGMDLDHEDLAGKLYANDDPVNGIDDDENGYIDDIYGYDFADEDPDTESDGAFHGTHVSGIAGAQVNNSIGIAGVGYNARIGPVKIFRSSDNTSNNSYDGIIYAADNGYDILTLSWGSTGSYSQFNQDVINYAVLERDVIVIAAAGNTPEDLEFYPASYENVLSVAATNFDDTKTTFSTYNRNVDLSAPGMDIYSTQNGNSYGLDGGTSHATPQVSGVAALVKHQFPELNALQIMERIRVTTDDISDIGTNVLFDGKLGKGRLNAFRAVSEEDVISTRSAPPVVNTSHPNGNFYYGDTIELQINLTNYLDPVFDLNIAFESESQFFNANNDPVDIEFLNTLQSTEVQGISYVVSENAGADQEMEIKLTYTDGKNYNDQQLFQLKTAPDHLDFGNDSLKVTLSGNGNLGYALDPFEEGIGLTWNSDQIAKDIGFIVTIDSTVILDNITNDLVNGGRDEDFNTITPIRPFDHPTANYTYNVFTGGDLIIEQTTLSWDSLPADVIAFSYRIVNNSSDTLKEIRTGIYTDFDLEDSIDYASTADLRTVFVGNDSTIFGGIRVLDPDSSISTLIDLTAILDTVSIITDSIKYEWTRPDPIDSIGFDTELDPAVFQGIYIDTLMPFQFAEVTFLISADNTLQELIANFNSAENQLNTFKDNPPIEDYFISCEGGNVIIDPSDGEQFYFFSDPYGMDTLAINDTLEVGSIQNDSLIFVANADELYPGPIRGMRIILSENIADFDIENDTFFLGDHPTNKVFFFDNSIQPNSWIWDFGNGSQASGIQDPNSIYNEPGTYDISLFVLNDQGCQDSVTRSITVLERPIEPTFDTLTICDGDNVNFNFEDDPLRLYLSEDSDVPIQEGNNLTITDILVDTSFYISRIEDQLESRKVKVDISIDKPITEYSVSPNLDSLAGHYINFSVTDAFQNVQWTINDSIITTTSTAIVDALSGPFRISLDLESLNGCPVTVQDTIDLVKSPTPLLNDIRICIGDSVTLDPGNGQYFGFYGDSTLSGALAKSETLTLTELNADTSIFIVGIDSLPGAALEVDILVEDFQFSIQVDPDTLYLENGRQVNFSTDSVEGTYTWHINNEIVGIGNSQVLFFDSASVFNVVLEGISDIGCTYTDSILFVVLNELPELPLGINNSTLRVFPNPSDGFIQIRPNLNIREWSISDIHGRQLKFSDEEFSIIDISELSNGIYILNVLLRDGNIITRRLIINKQ